MKSPFSEEVLKASREAVRDWQSPGGEEQVTLHNSGEFLVAAIATTEAKRHCT